MKLWQSQANKEIEKFTVGNDFLLDKKLLKYDCIASIAHAKMLCKIGILKKKEIQKLVKELQKISKMKNFAIKQSDEDCHTAIENYLTKKLGKIGKKIHTGRSRNDQVLVAIRLYEKDNMQKTKKLAQDLIKTIDVFTEKHGKTSIPGYTHMRKAMPCSIGMLFNAYKESLKDDVIFLDSVFSLIDQNPLGSAAGFGVPLKLDKQMTTKLLGFKKPQYTTYVQNSKGKFEVLILSALNNVMNSLNKIATDLLLFTTEEFGYFSLPEKLTTGSSIMPHKKNPDVLELLRAKTKLILGYLVQIDTLQKDLISGYNRDLQLIKEPIFKSFETTQDCLDITAFTIKNLKINKENCKKACTEELYSTAKALDLVKKGMPFRDAYKKVKN